MSLYDIMTVVALAPIAIGMWMAVIGAGYFLYTIIRDDIMRIK